MRCPMRGSPTAGKNSALTDYERFAQQRKRYVAAKREARLLKRQGDAAAEGGLLEHPWLAAARRSKHEDERPDPFRSRQPARSTTRRLIGAAIVLCLWLAAYGAWQSMDRSGEPSAAPESRPVFRVWHSLDGAEEARASRPCGCVRGRSLRCGREPSPRYPARFHSCPRRKRRRTSPSSPSRKPGSWRPGALSNRWMERKTLTPIIARWLILCHGASPSSRSSLTRTTAVSTPVQDVSSSLISKNVSAGNPLLKGPERGIANGHLCAHHS